MPSANAKKRKEKNRNNERNRMRKTANAEEKNVADEELEQQQIIAAELAGKSAAEIAKELAEVEISKKLIDDSTDVERQRAEQVAINTAARNTTGVLTTKELSSSIHIHALSILYHGQVLIEDTTLQLDSNHRYGIIGPNGCGKSTLMAAIGNREVPIPSNIDIFYLDHEMAPSDKTPLDAVMDVGEERMKLEKEAEILQDTDPESEYLFELYDRLDEMGADKAEAKASRILKGLGFTSDMQKKSLKDFSGGWRMRVSLARALFVKPLLLLLDEPTNHLDLEACVWLEEELKSFNHILMIVSHSQDFLNGVCTNIINFRSKKMEYYTGNYDQFIKTKSEVEESQMKRYNWEQEQIAHMKEYIARFGHGSAKLARQAQSKEKTLKKMVDQGLTEKVQQEKSVSFEFKQVDKLPPPVIQVQDISFQYKEGSPWIYKNVEFGLDQDTRLALVGPNGAGKSTLLKLIIGDLEPTDGMVRRHAHVKMGHYHQHLAEKLDMNLSPIEFMMREFKELKEIDGVRKIMGRYGITGKQQTMPIRNLSEGQKCRVALAWVAHQNPHMLMLDEPTNHLDLESIDALAAAIKKYNGGMILVSHDFRLISQVADEIWICERQCVTKWKDNDIKSYKELLKANVLGKDGKKQNMAAASADHYHKDDSNFPKMNTKAPVKTMKILGVKSNVNKTGSDKQSDSGAGDSGSSTPKKNGSVSPKSNRSAGGKFVPPGKRSTAGGKNSSTGKNSSKSNAEEWW